jgi:hypothetical protein
MNRSIPAIAVAAAGVFTLAACGAAASAAKSSTTPSPGAGNAFRNGASGQLVQINGQTLILTGPNGDITVMYTTATTFTKTSIASLAGPQPATRLQPATRRDPTSQRPGERGIRHGPGHRCDRSLGHGADPSERQPDRDGGLRSHHHRQRDGVRIRSSERTVRSRERVDGRYRQCPGNVDHDHAGRALRNVHDGTRRWSSLPGQRRSGAWHRQRGMNRSY